MPMLKGTGNTLLCSRFGYGKRISTRAKSVNSENRHDAGTAPASLLPQLPKPMLPRLDHDKRAG
jgi:hypothetical protein